jgi:hypothetical protein
MHFRDVDPKIGLHEVHFEVLFGTSTPMTGIVTIKPREGNLRKFSCGVIQTMGIRQGWTRWWPKTKEGLWMGSTKWVRWNR